MESDKTTSIVAAFADAVTQHKLSARRISRITNNLLSWRTAARVLHNHKHTKHAILCASTLAQLDRVTLVLSTARATGVVMPVPAESSGVERRANDLQYRMVYQRLYPN